MKVQIKDHGLSNSESQAGRVQRNDLMITISGQDESDRKLIEKIRAATRISWFGTARSAVFIRFHQPDEPSVKSSDNMFIKA